MQTQNNDKFPFYNSDIMNMANNGDSFAQLDIGKAYFHAYLTENNCSLAFKWISLSAHHGNMEAQFSVGDLYALGQGTEQSHTRAYEWYTKAALQGYSKALIRIHNLYEDDRLMHCKGYQNDKERFKWPRYYLHEIGAMELSEYRLQQINLIQNRAMGFYQEKFNMLIGKNELDNTDDQLQLGFMYQHGYGIKKSIKRAIICYTIAAKEGVTEAQYHLGEIYLKGRSRKYKYRDTFKWFSKAAKKGHVIAQCNLAYLYENGIGVEKDYSKALHWYTVAACARYSIAQLSIARIYRTGQGVLQIYSNAAQWYNIAAKGGNRAAQNCLDQLHSQEEINFDGSSISNLEYYNNLVDGRRMNSYLRKHISEINDTNKAKQLKKLAMSAMKRDINAMCEIGIKYRDSVDLPQDKDLSLGWIKKSARGGLEKAQLIIGELYEEGRLIEQNYHKASIWYKKKPLKQSDVFQYKLGMMYYNGNGVRRDYLDASKWFFKSADKKNSNSQLQLGEIKFLGRGVREDKFEAFDWYIKSAYQGNCDAMCQIGDNYFYGTISENDPFKKDVSEGVLWFKRAINHGNITALCHLISIYNDYKDELTELKLSSYFLDSYDKTTTMPYTYIKIATCYLNGYIVERDYIKAYHFIKKAIEKGNEEGKELLSIPVKLGGEMHCADLLKMYKLVSEEGIDNLEYNVGYVYEYGLRDIYSNIIPVKVNIFNAIEWYTAASNKGDSRAGYRLGVIYEEGKGVENNLSEAINFYTKAIGQGNENAMYRLAHLYLRGKGVTQNYGEAYRLFTDAHNMNQKFSHLFLKFFKETTHFIMGNQNRVTMSSEEDDQNELLYYSNENNSNILSLKMLEAVGHSGNFAVQYQLGCLYGNTDSRDRNYTQASYWFTLASQCGIADAYYRLGVLYEEGQGLKKNYLEYLKLYQKAAVKSHDKALYRLARMYHYGLGTPIDFKKAFMLYNESASQDNEMSKAVVTLLQTLPIDSSQPISEKASSLITSDVDATLKMYEYVAGDGSTIIQFDLGYYYEKNQLVSDYTKAVKWYSMAKDAGHIGATYRLGKLYELGLGVTQNYRCAIDLYKIAKEGGCNEATLRLGYIYQEGFGVNVDYKQAFKYYTEASEQGNPDAQFKLGQVYNERFHSSANILDVLKWYTKSYLQGNDNAREPLYLLYDNDKLYETFFHKQLAKILLSFAKDEKYHLYKKILSTSVIYARICHAYLNGQGVQKDTELAWYYLRIALELEFGYQLKILTDKTLLVIKDNAYLIYEMALKQAKKNSRIAHILLGMLYLGGVILLKENTEGDKKIYSSVFEDTCDLSDNSLYNESLSIGTIIVPKDYKKALKCFLKAADAGDFPSKLMVGQMYHCGYGTKQDFIKAFECYKSLIDYGAIAGTTKYCLGCLYAFGEGVDCDNNLALRYMDLNAFTGEPFINLAQLLYYGDDTIRNHKTALENLLKPVLKVHSTKLYLIRKIDENNLNGQSDSADGVYSIVSQRVAQGEMEYLLGIMYEKGQGTRVNYKEALDRFSKAVKCRNKKAESHLKLHYKDGEFIR